MRVFGLAAVAALAMVSSAQAATIYDSGDPDTSGGASLDKHQSIAMELSFGSAADITEVDGYLTTDNLSAPNPKFTLSVTGHNINGPMIFSTVVDATKPSSGWVGADGLSLDLAAGDYWFIFSAPEVGGFSGFFNRTSADQPFVRYDFQDVSEGGAWQGSGPLDTGFRVLGTGGSIMEFPLTGVPEPASWALMILGFGVTGAAIRRQSFSFHPH